MESAMECFYKISQCSSDLKESLSQNLSKEEDFDNLIERHIAASYNDNQTICDFVEGADWLNVSEPLSLHIHLRNKIVILDFWTYCCINCLHMLPELKKLEEAYSITDGVVFIGVHSAKFDHEREAENVRNAVLRHNVTHPVVNDHGAMWTALGITCWPTLLVLGPNCRPLYLQIGEGGFNVLHRYIKVCVKYFYAELDKSNLKITQTCRTDITKSVQQLNYPGRIASFNYANDCIYLAVSDSANNRIIIIRNGTDIIKIIGGSKRGYKDGDIQSALFANPQGITFYNENIIFVADCENHCIRKIDLLHNKVVTVAGTGSQSEANGQHKPNSETLKMRSPWGLALYTGEDFNFEKKTKKSILFIAMAGSHQIWALFLDTCVWWKRKIFAAGSCEVISGTGNEENRNNSYPMSAAFAQPSGLAINYLEKEMYIADSESSTIRKMCLTTGRVSSVVGGERDPFNLFAYGDIDGTLYEAKLKHPLDVVWSSKHDRLFVADTFNNKIKSIDTKSNMITTSWNSTNFNLKEPGGLCLLPDQDYLIIADTNNNRLVRININDGKGNTLNLSFTPEQKKNVQKNVMVPDSIFQKNVFIGNLQQVSFSVRFIDTSIKLNRDVKQNWKVHVDNNKNIVIKKEVRDNIFNFTLALDDDCINENIQMMFRLALCTGEICFMKMFSLEFMLHREKSERVSYKHFTENTLLTVENNEMKIISSMATMT